MNIGILHLSDIHINSDKDYILGRVDQIVSAIKESILDITRLYIAISGDIINCGKTENYTPASTFLNDLKTKIGETVPSLEQIEFVLVPGNHDCDFKNEDDFRALVVKKIIESGEIEKESWAESALNPQTAFWTFAHTFNPLISDKPQKSFNLSIPLEDARTIQFHCYNTALTSTISEAAQTLIVTPDSLMKRDADSKDIVVSIFHHNTGWLSTHTPFSRKDFEEHLAANSDIVLCGHEHHSQNLVTTSLKTCNSYLYVEGGALQSEKGSSFNLIIIDTVSRKCTLQEFASDKSEALYRIENSNTVQLGEIENGISCQKDHIEFLNKIDLPLNHPSKKELALDDIFVYPYIDPQNIENDILVDQSYLSSNTLSLKQDKPTIYILEGEVQSGKTSLLKRLSRDFIEKGFYPIWTRGKDWGSNDFKNIEIVLKNKYKQQYNTRIAGYDQFRQIQSSRKVIVIDNFEQSQLNEKGKIELLKNLCKVFGTVIVTLKPFTNMNPLIDKNIQIKYFNLVQFGFELRQELVEKWKRIGIDENTVDNEALNRDIQLTANQLTLLLTNQLVPSYPVFLLTLIQAMELAAQNITTEPTGYAYCYNAVLMHSLISQGVKEKDIEGYLNFLEHLAYSLYEGKIGKDEMFSEEEFLHFYESYKERFNFNHTFETTLRVFLDSRLLKETDGYYYQGYKYVFYYLVAKTLSDQKDEKRKKTIIDLCNNITDERSANILIFMVYHKSDSDLIEELLITGVIPFEDVQPLTLDVNDPNFPALENMFSTTKEAEETVDKNVDYREHQKETLREIDRQERALTHHPAEEDEEERIEPEDIIDDSNVLEFQKTLTVIKILGQIVKNNRDKLELNRLRELVETSYLAGFRALAFQGQLTSEATSLLVESMKERHGLEDKDKLEIESRVRLCFSSLFYGSCLNMFTYIAMTVGASALDKVYGPVAQKIDSPAAKLVSFSIESYYKKFNLTELTRILKDLKNNVIARRVIRARVRNHIYNTPLSEPDKQRLCDLCNMKLISGPKRG